MYSSKVNWQIAIARDVVALWSERIIANAFRVHPSTCLKAMKGVRDYARDNLSKLRCVTTGRHHSVGLVQSKRPEKLKICQHILPLD